MTWAWWMTLAVILAVLLLIGCIPVGVDAAYGEGGIRLAVKIWLFRLQLLPQKPKRRKNQPKRLLQSKASAGKPAGGEKPNPLLSGGVDGILELLDLGVQTLGDLRRKLCVEELTLHVCIGGSDDPAAAAMRYGRAWAAIGAITPALDRLFVIKNVTFSPRSDYNETSMKVDARLITTITIGRSSRWRCMPACGS